MMEQIIPSHFGRFRRWCYTRYPLQYPRDLCPLTSWKHAYVSDDGSGWGMAECACGRRVYVEYGP